jgi:hypothetical protein
MKVKREVYDNPHCGREWAFKNGSGGRHAYFHGPYDETVCAHTDRRTTYKGIGAVWEEQIPSAVTAVLDAPITMDDLFNAVRKGKNT